MIKFWEIITYFQDTLHFSKDVEWCWVCLNWCWMHIN